MTAKQPTPAAFTVLKKASCPTLSQTGTITYELSLDSNGQAYFSLTGNSGSGYFSKARQPLYAILNTLGQFAEGYPITAFAQKACTPTPE